jgi:hypothetical protein
MLQPYIAKIAVIGWGLALLLAAALWVQSARHATASAAIDTARAAEAAAVTSANNWRGLSGRLVQDLEACNKDRLADRERDEAAVIAAQAAQRDADRTLRAWLDRYAAATASAECAAVERMVVCEVPE